MQSPERYEHIPKTSVENEREQKVWKQFLAKLRQKLAEDMKNCPHKVLSEWGRHSVFLGHYFYYINFKSEKDAARLKKVLKGYADVYTLEEHCELMLQVYNRKIVTMNKFL